MAGGGLHLFVPAAGVRAVPHGQRAEGLSELVVVLDKVFAGLAGFCVVHSYHLDI